MTDELHILFVEDNAEDIASVRHALKNSKQALDIKCVVNMDDFSRALSTSHWDIILSDVNLPELMVKDILLKLQELSLLIPLVVVAKPIGEEVVAQFLRAGVSNYVSWILRQKNLQPRKRRYLFLQGAWKSQKHWLVVWLMI